MTFLPGHKQSGKSGRKAGSKNKAIPAKFHDILSRDFEDKGFDLAQAAIDLWQEIGTLQPEYTEKGSLAGPHPVMYKLKWFEIFVPHAKHRLAPVDKQGNAAPGDTYNVNVLQVSNTELLSRVKDAAARIARRDPALLPDGKPGHFQG